MLLMLCLAAIGISSVDPRYFDPGAELDVCRKPSVYAPAFFWIWNDTLDVDMLCSQLDEMKANGLENVCIHPMPRSFRPDSIDSSMSPDYLTPEYFEVYARVTRHAARLGMHSYLYDEGGWPSGSACGLVAAGDREGRFRMRSVQLDGDDRPVVVAEPYVGPAPRTSIVEKGMTEEFIRLTHASYAETTGDCFGKTVRIAFTDEPDMPRSVPGVSLGWTADFLDVFRKKKGYDILPYVPDLIRRHADTDDRLVRTRIDYHDVMADLMVERFLDPVRGWCRAHGLLSGGHFNTEDEPVLTPERGFGSILRSLRALDAPGIDVIWRQLFPATVARPARTGCFPRFASSAAHVNGSSVVIAEAFGVFGDSLTPSQMRWVVDYLLVRGINSFVFAYYNQTNARQWMYLFGPHNGPVVPSWPMQKPFFTYVRRMSDLLAAGRPGAEIAVLYDVRGLWAGGAYTQSAAAGLEAAAKTLDAMNCDYDFVDDDVLALAAVLPGGLLRVGKAAYRSLVLPTSRWMRPEARAICDSFRRAGGRVVGLEDIPGVPRTLAVSGPGARHVRVMRRFNGERTVYAVMNEDMSENRCLLRFPEDVPVAAYVPETDSYEEIGSGETSYAFAPGELRVFICGDIPACRRGTHGAAGTSLVLDRGWTVRRTVSHAVGRRNFEISKVSERARATPLGDWRGIFGERFSGRAVYRNVFTHPVSEDAELDLGDVKWCASVKLNGRDLGPRFFGPYRWNIGLAAGTNVLEVTVANLLVNQMGHDDVRDRLLREFVPSTYDVFQREFDRANHASGLFGPVILRLDRKK